MNKNNHIAIENIIRHYFKKAGYVVKNIEFVEPIIYDDGGESNRGVNVFFDKEFNWSSKNYRIFRRCEDRLLKKYNVDLIIDE